MFCAVDIDNTITDPKWFDPDVQITIEQYIRAGIISREGVADLHYHPDFYLLPQIALTHLPKEGAVETLQEIASLGIDIQYFTVRNHINPDICQAIHTNTHTWLETHHFPNPSAVKFFWSMSDKLVQALETPENPIFFIDDRPGGLIKAYHHIAEQDPQKAQHIQERITVIAFGYSDTLQFSSGDTPRIIPAKHWSHVHELLPLQRKSS